jgi:hypothetical protein
MDSGYIIKLNPTGQESMGSLGAIAKFAEGLSGEKAVYYCIDILSRLNGCGGFQRVICSHRLYLLYIRCKFNGKGRAL